MIISTTSVSHLFLQREDNLSLENFIVRMAQRMTVFALCPNLNPMATHSGAATGCLFDFTIVLAQVVDVVKTPFICQTCAEIIKKDRGAEFLKRLHDWLQSTA